MVHSSEKQNTVPASPEDPSRRDALKIMGASAFALAFRSVLGADDKGHGNNERKNTLQTSELQARLEAMMLQGAIEWVDEQTACDCDHCGCGDGRRTKPVAGTFGGSTGRLIMDMQALELTTGKKLTPPQVQQLIDLHIAKGGGLHLHTDDIHGMHKLAEKLKVKESELDALLKNPGDRHDDVLKALLHPDTMGCGHLKTMVNASESANNDYKVRPALIKTVLTSVFDKKLKGGKVNYEVLHGAHDERGVLFVDAKGDKIPLIPPTHGKESVFVVTPAAERALDQKFASTAPQALGLKVDQRELLDVMQDLGKTHTSATAKALKADQLPYFSGTFDAGQRKIDVKLVKPGK